MYQPYRRILFCFMMGLCAHAQSQTGSDGQWRIVGYLNTWEDFPASVDSLPFEKITHLNIAFAEPDARGNLTEFKELPKVVDKAHGHRVKVLMSLGGADLDGTKKYWKKFTDPAHVKLFCNKIADYVLKNKLDGIDVDLEGNIIGSQYANFVKTLSAVLKPKGKLLTGAVATWFAEQVPAGCFRYFDFLDIMSFDQTGPGDAGHPGPHSPYSMAVADLRFWRNKGLPREKMGLGLPFYGYGFYVHATVEEVAYKDILKRYPGAEMRDKAGHTIYYNGLPTIKEKTRLALREASGVMIWELTGDTHGEKSLLSAIDSIAHPR